MEEKIITAEHSVDSYYEEMRLDYYLAHHYSEFSRSKIQEAIKSGNVWVNKKVGKKSTLLHENDLVIIYNDALEEVAVEEGVIHPQEMDLDIIFEDEHYLAINKPAGLVVHPGNGNPDGTLLNGIYHYLADTPGTPRLVHRLDKDTSGVIMVAKNEQSHEALGNLFIDRKVYKGYLGICIGKYPDRGGIIDAPLGRSKIDPIKRTIRPDGRESRTDYALLRYRNGVSLLAFRLHTGRTHQIRVHSAFSGFPILADMFYGGDKPRVKQLEPMERPFAYRLYSIFDRQALHARYISFIHPFTGEECAFTAPLHPDFEKAITALDLEPEDLSVFRTDLLDRL